VVPAYAKILIGANFANKIRSGRGAKTLPHMNLDANIAVEVLVDKLKLVDLLTCGPSGTQISGRVVSASTASWDSPQRPSKSILHIDHNTVDVSTLPLPCKDRYVPLERDHNISFCGNIVITKLVLLLVHPHTYLYLKEGSIPVNNVNGLLEDIGGGIGTLYACVCMGPVLEAGAQGESSGEWESTSWSSG